MKVFSVHEVLNATRVDRDRLAGKLLAINNYCQKNGIGDWGGSASEALIAHCDALTAKADALNALIVAMQERAALYLQPDGEPNESFINYVLAMLDGPEQRAAQAAPAQCLAAQLRHQTERAEMAEIFIENLGLHIDAGADIRKIAALLEQWIDADHGERLADVRADAIESASSELYNAGIADESASDWLVLYAAKVRGGAK